MPICRPNAARNAAAASQLERQLENEPKPSKALVGFAAEEALSEAAASPSKIFSDDGWIFLIASGLRLGERRIKAIWLRI